MIAEFDRPGFLLLLLAIPLLALLARGSLASLSPSRSRLTFGLRALLLLLISVALADPRWLVPMRLPNVLFLVDESRSMDGAGREKAELFLADALKNRPLAQRSAVLRFAKSAWLESGFSGETGPPVAQDREETHLAAAILRGSALFPAGPGRMVVLSDGGETETAPSTASVDREVDAVILPMDSRPDAWLEALVAPDQVREGETFNVNVSVGSNVDKRAARVALYQDGFLVEEKLIETRRGNQSLVFKNLRTTSGKSSLEAVVFLPEDPHPASDRLTTAVVTRGQPRILLVDPNPSQLNPLAEALRGGKMNVEIRPPAGLPTTLEALQSFDLVLLSDTPAQSLPSGMAALLPTWVKDFGGGLIVTGGENSFGAGSYSRTALEPILPVLSEHPDKLESPVAALEIVLDRSGSMTAIVSGQTKMDLANQGAIMALNQLQSRDYFGVLAVDVRPQTVLPLSPPGDRKAAANAIRGIRSSGGGIYVYSALVDAYRQLRSVPAKLKHVILFADASDADEKSGSDGQSAEALTVAARTADVTTSVVALGKESDKDVAFLRSLAQAGNGRFYLTDDATTLPQLFAMETQRATQSSFIEEPFIPDAREAPVLAGLDWNSAPPLLGYNAVKLRPGSEALLTTPNGDPLLALWPVGLGEVAAFTSDVKSRWAAEWLTWSGYGKFWGQLIRAMLPDRSSADFEVSLIETSKDLKIQIQSDRDREKFVVRASSSSGFNAAPEVGQVAPGIYEATLAKRDAADFSLSINEESGRSPAQFRYWSRGYPREFGHSTEAEARIRERVQTTGGKLNPSPADVWRPVAEAESLPVSLAPYFLVAAIFVFLIDLWNRRRPAN